MVAYRWARTTLVLRSVVSKRIDVSVVSNAIDEARRALRELARIEAKAKAIAHGAQSLVSFQVRRMNAALDDAAAGLSNQEIRPAS